MSELPDFGEGRPDKRVLRRLAFCIGGFSVGLIFAIAVYPILA